MVTGRSSRNSSCGFNWVWASGGEMLKYFVIAFFVAVLTDMAIKIFKVLRRER